MKKSIGFQLLIFIALDQCSKWILVNYLPSYAISNPGIAFGLEIPPLILLFLIPILIILGFFIFRKYFDLKDKLIQFLATLILAGAIGNYIDRILCGHVIDFIRIGFWPSFNFADTFLCVGIIGLVLKTILNKK